MKVPVLFGGLRFSIQWEFPLSVETNGTGTCKPAWLSTRLSRDGINGPEKRSTQRPLSGRKDETESGW